MSRSNPWKRKPRSTRHTTLIVVEGDTERALVNYLKILCGRNCVTRVTIENAHGGSGDGVLQLAIKLCSNAFDSCACLYDTDRAPTIKRFMDKARKLKIQEIPSAPCIEGLLLEILGEKVPSSSDECKRAMGLIVGSDSLTDCSTYEKYFSKNLFERRRLEVCQLNALLKLIKRNEKA